jgi:hypothetical protein
MAEFQGIETVDRMWHATCNVDEEEAPMTKKAKRCRVFGAAGLAATLGLAACAAGPMRMAARPGPAKLAQEPGPYGTTISVYDPALYGPDAPLSQIIAARRLRLRDGKLLQAVLLVNKGQERLELWVKRRMIKAYRIQLGWHPLGPKLRQGDQKTPEGTYLVCAHRTSPYYLALWLSYPNAEDARRGLRSGLIDPAQYERILKALDAGRCPPADTSLGGAILVHGQWPELTAEMARKHEAHPSTLPPGWRRGDADPADFREYQDWTDGCIALFNPDDRELYEYIPDGATVVIAANAAVTRPRPLPRR